LLVLPDDGLDQASDVHDGASRAAEPKATPPPCLGSTSCNHESGVQNVTKSLARLDRKRR